MVKGLALLDTEAVNNITMNQIINNKKHGKWIYYFDSNNKQYIAFSAHYINGVHHGLCCDYFSNGKLHYTGHYNNGFMTGLWKYWGIDGTEVSNRFFLR